MRDLLARALVVLGGMAVAVAVARQFDPDYGLLVAGVLAVAYGLLGVDVRR